MLRRNFHLRNDQDRFLRSLEGSDSEHVRQALDDYKRKIEEQKVNASTSKS